jgi:thiamine biosynthesis lipoprotein
MPRYDDRAMLPLLLALSLGAPPPLPTGPVRQTSQAFGQPVEVEVRGLSLEAAREAIGQAVSEVAAFQRLEESAIAALNAAAGKGPQTVDPRILAVLARAWSFCDWSDGAHGPLGRDLYALWGLRAPVAEAPDSDQIQQVAATATCGRLSLDSGKGTATLAAGSGLDLLGFVEGAAVDHAVEILRQRKAADGFVRIGAVQRGFGPGPNGKGWPVALPQFPGQEGPADQIYLRDRAIATASQSDHPLGGGALSYLNQRTGLPATGTLATVAVSELALDAQGLATSMLILGPRAGQLRIGTLRPRPSLLWYLGSGEGTPLVVDYRWSDVIRR